MESRESVFFVRVESPDELRKRMLDLWKGTIVSLERYEKFKGIRQERLDSIEKFKGDVKKIHSMLSELKGKLPQPDLKGVAGEPKKHAKEIKEPIKQGAKPKERTEMEKLENELRDIESKLKSLM